MPIPTPSQAAETLRQLLAQVTPTATEAALRATGDALDRFNDPLSEFQVPAEPEYELLRAEAKGARKALRSALTAAALERMEERTESLARYATAIDAVAEKTMTRARALTLNSAQRMLDSTTLAIDAAAAAELAIQDRRWPEAADALAAVHRQIPEIRAAARDIRG